MRAAVYERYGPPEVVTLRELPVPVPGATELLIRVRATTVSTGDWRVRSLDVPFGFRSLSRLMFGISRPRQQVLGTELTGEVVEVGAEVTRFRVGDEVIVFDGARMGCHVEYKCVAEDGAIARRPEGLPVDQAAALCFGGTTMLDFFRRGKLRSGERVLVNGASGCVGSAAVQLARHAGAEVTGVCSTRNLELVQGLGAEHVIDYTAEDFTTNGAEYDVIVDVAGTAPYSRCRRALAAGGRLLQVLGGLPDLLRIPLIGATTSHRVVGGPAAERPEAVAELAALAESGAFRPVVGRVFRFEEIVEAHREVETGHKVGSVVVLLDPPSAA